MDQIQNQGEIILYQTEDGQTRVQCRFEENSIWLTQAAIAELFQTTPQNITLHVKAIYAEGEQKAETTCKPYLQVRTEGNRQVQRSLKYYNLDVILAVGYRVRSIRGIQFRQWATQQLKELMAKGFVLDDERLKNPGPGRPDYFDELLERIRDIRASEKRMYLRVRDILALAADYHPEEEVCHRFFQTIQNKLHFAVSGKTAPEIIYERAKASLPNMGLTTWSKTSVRKSDVTVAKNYLQEQEITELNRMVSMFLDYAEDQAQRRKQVFLQDWQTRLDSFLQFNERDVLSNAGSISREQADRKACEEYERFAAHRRELQEKQGEEEMRESIEDAVKRIPRKS
ncbi:MAG TPA: virulence RhuM family protein [Fibrobacteraceae bacterium]|nr:virulence RhuM family protein [Fibrobacteraceae bacterium]